ncbi:MAG: cupredoxin domain-containing protein [Candidatus Binataceae bacterium]
MLWLTAPPLAAPARAGDVITIKMKDMPPSFEPQRVTVTAGQIVKWENDGNMVHHATNDTEAVIKASDVTAPSKAAVFDSGFMRPGETFSYTFNEAGVYKYVCAAHEASGMSGEIIVQAGPTKSASEATADKNELARK